MVPVPGFLGDHFLKGTGCRVPSVLGSLVAVDPSAKSLALCGFDTEGQLDFNPNVKV